MCYKYPDRIGPLVNTVPTVGTVPWGRRYQLVPASTSIDTVGGGTMKRQSTRTYAASLHKVNQRYERRKWPACTARLRTFRYLDRLLTPPSRRVTARRRLREHSRASAIVARTGAAALRLPKVPARASTTPPPTWYRRQHLSLIHISEPTRPY